MTSITRDTALAAVLANSGPVLLDFDGPVTQLMPEGIDRKIADAMRAELMRSTGTVPAEVAETKDPLAVLSVAAAVEPTEVMAAVEDVCRAGEVDAALRAVPSPGGHEALRACRGVGRPVVVVSNNAPEAITAYLARHDLHGVACIGYAKTPQRGRELQDAGADALVSSMDDLADAIRQGAPPNRSGLVYEPLRR